MSDEILIPDDNEIVQFPLLYLQTLADSWLINYDALGFDELRLLMLSIRRLVDGRHRQVTLDEATDLYNNYELNSLDLSVASREDVVVAVAEFLVTIF